MNKKTVTKSTGNRNSGETGNPVIKAAKSVERSSRSVGEDRAKFMKLMFEGANKGKWHGVLSLVHPKSVNERDGHGRTLIMLAAAQGEMDAVEKLVDKGADVNLWDSCGRTALMHALRNEQHEVAKWLKENGADWKADLEVLVMDRRKMMIFSMIDVLGVTGDDVAEAEAKFDPKRGPALSHRVRRLIGSDSGAVMGLELLSVPREEILGAASKPPGEGGERAERKNYMRTTDFVC